MVPDKHLNSLENFLMSKHDEALQAVLQIYSVDHFDTDPGPTSQYRTYFIPCPDYVTGYWYRRSIVVPSEVVFCNEFQNGNEIINPGILR